MLRIPFAALIALAFLTSASASPPSPKVPRRPTIRYFIATAYSVEGTGASGKWSHPGAVAADRKVLPLNTRIRIYGAVLQEQSKPLMSSSAAIVRTERSCCLPRELVGNLRNLPSDILN